MVTFPNKISPLLALEGWFSSRNAYFLQYSFAPVLPFADFLFGDNLYPNYLVLIMCGGGNAVHFSLFLVFGLKVSFGPCCEIRATDNFSKATKVNFTRNSINVKSYLCFKNLP